MKIPEEILKISRPKNTIVKFNSNSNTFYVVKRTSKRVEGKKNPIPVEVGVVGKIDNGKFVECDFISNGIDIKHDGDFIFFDKYSSSFYQLLKQYTKKYNFIYSLIYLSIINNSSDFSTFDLLYNSSSISLKYKNLSFNKSNICRLIENFDTELLNYFNIFNSNVSFNYIINNKIVTFNNNLLPYNIQDYDKETYLSSNIVLDLDGNFDYKSFNSEIKFISNFDDYNFITINKLDKSFTNQFSFGTNLVKYKLVSFNNFYYYSYKIDKNQEINIYISNVKLDPKYLFKIITNINNNEYSKFITNNYKFSNDECINNRFNLLIQLFYNNLNNIIFDKKSNCTLFYIFNYLSNCYLKSGSKVYNNWSKCGLYNSDNEILKLI